jgi:hypothetical protein
MQPIHYLVSVTALGADQLIPIGFKPRYVHIQNLTDLGEFEFYEGMTDDHALYIDGATGIQTEVSSNGITPTAGTGHSVTLPGVSATQVASDPAAALTVGTSITVTAGSNIVTGVGTAFASELFKGARFKVNGEIHVVKSYTTALVITTEAPFVASAVATSGKRLDPLPPGIFLGADTNMNAAADVLRLIAVP